MRPLLDLIDKKVFKILRSIQFCLSAHMDVQKSLGCRKVESHKTNKIIEAYEV